jgi:hypothetical protein
MTAAMYTRDHLCSELKPGLKCFVVQQYNEANVTIAFHEHVPAHRISQESEGAVLHDLALHYGGYSGISILRSRLNNRRGDPTRFPTFHHHVSYPEEGVIRQSVTCTSATVWLDSVISPQEFRKHGAEK